ncbi:MAG: DUF1893 domain-containing protein [Ruminococcaceae bacterium]|nr:DUF1893 domain-containing protein [Oscillospiraceae bacterium]
MLNTLKTVLKSGDFTCVIQQGERRYTARARGVAPLLSFYRSGEDFHGALAADKVVGAAAAYLYVLLGVGQVYAGVMSERAAAVLTENGILFEADVLVPLIKNRTGDGFCPMERAVWHLSLSDAQGAIAVIETTMARLIAKK